MRVPWWGVRQAATQRYLSQARDGVPGQDLFDDSGVLKKIPPRVKPIRRKRESLIRVPETPPIFHPRAQRNAFRRRDARQQ